MTPAARVERCACWLAGPRASGSYPGPPRPAVGRPGCRPVARRTPRGAPPHESAAPARRRAPPPRRRGSPSPLEPRRPRCARRPGHQAGDHLVPGGSRERPAQLLRDPELAGGVGEQVADALDRAARRQAGIVEGARRAHADASTSLAPGAAVPGSVGRPPSTRQAVPAARSAGSRSSSVVVVTKACGSVAIRRTRWARRAGSSSEKTSSRSRSGGLPSSPARRSSSASLRARIAVRCWPREANEESSRPSSAKARSSRCGPTRVVPFQSSFSAVSRRRRASAAPGVSPASAGAFVDVRQPQDALLGRDLGVRRRQGGRELVQERVARVEDGRPGLEELRVPEGELVARRLLLADRPQQVVALGQHPPVGGQVGGVGREALGREGVEGRPPKARGADDEKHLLGREDDRPHDARPAPGCGAAPR